MFPHLPKFLTSACEGATRRPFSYLIIDLNQETLAEVRVRSNILHLLSAQYLLHFLTLPGTKWDSVRGAKRNSEGRLMYKDRKIGNVAELIGYGNKRRKS